MQTRKIVLLFCIVPLIGCLVMISAFFKEKSLDKENKKTEHAFVIKGLHQNGIKKLYVNDGRVDILFIRPFYLSDRDSLRIGDSIYKAKGAQYLYIYRKDTEGEYQLYHRVKSELNLYDPDEINPYFDIR